MASSRTAVVLFNLGGPDSPAAVKPFLFNLFHDPAIISISQPWRWLLAKLISGRRAPVARAIYERIGGKSPLLDLTRDQAKALQAALAERANEGAEYLVSIAMRYWHPFSDAAVKEVKAFAPDRVILLPLYPQFSTTTGDSSLGDWKRAAIQQSFVVETSSVCCYPTTQAIVAAQARLIRPVLAEAAATGRPRVLFSAHGLPKKIVDGGDPYQWQVEQTVAAVLEELGPGAFDAVTCYQSKVGRLEWIGPSTDDEIKTAGREGRPVVVVPIAFVSDHSETLVELDIEYRELAEQHGVPAYHRVPVLGTDTDFIAALADLVQAASERPGFHSQTGGRLCPKALGRCAQA